MSVSDGSISGYRLFMRQVKPEFLRFFSNRATDPLNLSLAPDLIEHMFDTETIFELTQTESERSSSLPDRDVLPGNLESIPSGPFLAGVLSSVDRSRLNGYDAVRVLEADARMVSYFQSLMYESMAEVAHCPPSNPDSEVARDSSLLEFGCEEIGTALSLTRRAADSELGFALSLQSRLPKVAAALREGRIDVRRAKVFDRETFVLDPDVASEVCDRLLPDASELTTGQLRARLALLVIKADPEAAQERMSRGLEDRRVTAEANPDGTAALFGHQLAPVRVQRVRKRLDRLARQARTGGDPRTMDQLRADVFLDLLEGTGHGDGSGGAGSVHITATLDTLARLSEVPGELAGYGPVIADIARQVVDAQHDTEWKISVTDDDGHLIHVGTTKRRPNKTIRRIVEAVNPTCVFPGCRMPSVDCDIDHRRPWYHGGVTCPCNLAPLCRRHHQAKDKGGWKLERNSEGHQWTTPLSHTYTTPHHPP